MIDLLRYGELINQYTAQRGGPTTGAKVGSGIAASLPYMAGFGATSKIGSSGANTLGKCCSKGSENALGERASQAGRIHGERGCNDTLTGGYLLKLP